MLKHALSPRRMGTNVLCVILSASLAPGCTAWKRIPPSQGSFREAFQPGDQLRIVTRGGRVLDYVTVTAITEDGLVGDLSRMQAIREHQDGPITVAFSDIARVERAAGPTLAAKIVPWVLLVGTLLAYIGFRLFMRSAPPSAPPSAPATAPR